MNAMLRLSEANPQLVPLLRALEVYNNNPNDSRTNLLNPKKFIYPLYSKS